MVKQVKQEYKTFVHKTMEDDGIDWDAEDLVDGETPELAPVRLRRRIPFDEAVGGSSFHASKGGREQLGRINLF